MGEMEPHSARNPGQPPSFQPQGRAACRHEPRHRPPLPTHPQWHAVKGAQGPRRGLQGVHGCAFLGVLQRARARRHQLHRACATVGGGGGRARSWSIASSTVNYASLERGRERAACCRSSMLQRRRRHGLLPPLPAAPSSSASTPRTWPLEQQHRPENTGFSSGPVTWTSPPAAPARGKGSGRTPRLARRALTSVGATRAVRRSWPPRGVRSRSPVASRGRAPKRAAAPYRNSRRSSKTRSSSAPVSASMASQKWKAPRLERGVWAWSRVSRGAAC